MNQELVKLVQQTPFLSQGDKSFLLDKISEMNPLDKLKLEHSLKSSQAPEILQNLQLIRAKFFASEAPKKEDILTKITNVLTGTKKNRTIVAKSLVTQPQLLGSPVPKAIHENRIIPLNSLEEFNYPGQLSLLTQNHINFGLNSNTEQIMQNFLNKLTRVFERITDVNLKRAYFINFLESQLFGKYINTTLTALRHPELKPSKIILNLLYQINPEYLNNKQFQLASVICNHLRNLCGL